MLTNQVALVTGGSRGIGRAICQSFAQKGAHVVINYAGNRDAALETQALCQVYGVQTLVIQADVSDAVQVDAMLQEVLATFGRIDILVNNAGITRDNLLMRLSEQDFDAVIDTNLKGAFLCMKGVCRPMMKQRKGSIINLSSVVGLSGNAGQVNYAASKAGIVGMTKAFAKEVASRNIRVNAVAPGFIETDMTQGLSPDALDNLPIPLKRLGTPQDVANLVTFLASQQAAYITGQVLCVDGGMLI